MRIFLYNATDSDGKKVTERIESEDIEQARSALEGRGYSAIVFHYDEGMEKVFASGEEISFQKLPPAIEVEMLKE